MPRTQGTRSMLSVAQHPHPHQRLPTLTSLRSSRSGRAGSRILSRQSTARGDSRELFWLMILLLREVLAALTSCSRSSMLTGIALSVRICSGDAGGQRTGGSGQAWSGLALGSVGMRF